MLKQKLKPMRREDETHAGVSCSRARMRKGGGPGGHATKRSGVPAYYGPYEYEPM